MFGQTADGKNKYTNTVVVGDSSKPPLVLIHGYGGSGMLFYKSMKGLSENFHLFCIDIIGMGASSRCEFSVENSDEADKYFLDFLEQWRIAMDNLTNFFLLGHSFGGYLAGMYAV